MVKALREAKRNTNWVEQDHDWEEAVRRFCGALYDDRGFLEPRSSRSPRASRQQGERAALGQLVLKLTAPGIPDIYQGDELSYRALVDPDNRRPVDWAWRQAMLRRLMGGSPPVAETRKLFLILRLLGLRARRPEAFVAGAYEPRGRGPRRVRVRARRQGAGRGRGPLGDSGCARRRPEVAGATCSAARSARSTAGSRLTASSTRTAWRCSSGSSVPHLTQRRRGSAYRERRESTRDNHDPGHWRSRRARADRLRP